MRVATRSRPGSYRALATVLGALALVFCGVASAAHDTGGHGGGGGGSAGGGGHGGGHAASGGHGGAHAGAAPRAAYGHGAYAHYYRGGAPGGSGYRPRASAIPGGARGGYYRGPGYGHGGYGGYGGWWHGRYWGGIGLGLYFATLPWYYETFWWGGVPYYYADDSFYRWNDTVAQYETVAAPAEDADGAGPAAAAGELYVYPRQHQSDEQQKRDRYDCHRWASGQTGFDPTRASGGVGAEAAPAQAGAYRRAESACLEGRGYTVR